MTQIMTYEKALQEAISRYIKSKNNKITVDDISNMAGEVLVIANDLFDAHNAACPKDEQWRKLQKLEPFMIAELIPHMCIVRKIRLGGNDSVLAIYQDHGEREGTYLLDPIDENYLTGMICSISPSIPTVRIKEARACLRTIVPEAEITRDPDLIAVANGIFDYRTKELKPFSPDHVFTIKLATAYRNRPANPFLHNDKEGTNWDVESWMRELSDDPEVINLLWLVIGAVVRPGVRWDKAIFLSGSSGCNGKGTYCELLRNLCGRDGYHMSLSIRDCSSKFLPYDLASVKAVITDENSVGDYIDLSDTFKAMITCDALALEAKFRDKITARFSGVMIQCLNDYVKFRDRTESLYRRLLMVPFLKRFTGMERKYIKHDYLHRPEVLEYVLWRVLHMQEYYELPEPEACAAELEKYKDSNDPLRVFLSEILPELKWQTVPFEFLYDLYKSWIVLKNPGGKIPSAHVFKGDVAERINTNRANPCYAAWNPVEYDYKNRGFKVWKVSAEDQMTPEPLINEYCLEGWMNRNCKSNDWDKLCISPKHTGAVRGIRRA